MVNMHPSSTTPAGSAPHEAAAHEPALTTYFVIFAALMVLLVLTVAAAFLPHHFGNLNLVIALFIACLKASMVIYYFMHVRDSSRLTKVFVLASFLWLGIMFVLTFSDYFSRFMLPMSNGWDRNPVVVAPN